MTLVVVRRWSKLLVASLGGANANPAIRQMRLPRMKTYMWTHHVDAVKTLLVFGFSLRPVETVRIDYLTSLTSVH